MNSSSAVIAANNLAVGYSGTTVWQDATFRLYNGEFIAILGPNGAGKSTLFRLLLGLTRPTQGTLSVLGQTPRRGSSRIGYVPQRHSIDGEINIEALEFVRLGLAGDRWGFGGGRKERAQALEALGVVDAKELAHRPLGVLSGGEAQRVFLAQALVGNPELLLLDEPLANLDIRRETELVKLINRIVRSEGVTVLLIAHNINPLLPFLDRVVYVANGRVATGSPQEVLTSASLTKLYDIPVEVLQDSHGRIAIVGTEEAEHHYE